ncbi:hypothetical protein [Streptomyces sp. NPDC058953]|uniref:hypothetical protein n=1 Tax=unclassified Streptomyces TaxID=2593676 RepID=UPI0036953CEE
MNGRRGRSAGRTVAGAAAVALSVLLTGCGGDGGDGSKDEVAAVDEKKAAENQKKKIESELSVYIDAQRKYVGCMRENGVDVSDPDAKGRVTYGGANKELKSDPEFIKAGEVCAKFNTIVPDSLEREMNPKPTEKEIGNRKRYSICMQENGAPDFPDARDDGSYEEVPWDSAAAGARRAGRKCEPILGPVPKNVTPKG